MTSPDIVQGWLTATYPAVTPSRPVSVPIASTLVAFGGVLCVALDGFPAPIAAFKANLSSDFGGCGRLPPELMGSMWAKVTVAAVHDDVKAQASTPEVWDRVRSAVMAWNEFQSSADAVQGHVLLEAISVVSFQCRSLATCEEVASTPICALTADTEGCGIDDASRRKGASIVSEFTSESSWAEYRDGGIIARLQVSSSYHQLCTGRTIVSFLADRSLRAYLGGLREHLAKHDLEWLFDWMPEASLHVTVRGL